MKILILSFLLATAAVAGGYVLGEALVDAVKKLVRNRSSFPADSSAGNTDKDNL